jgi:mono/diheme cytochrome c family protein
MKFRLVLSFVCLGLIIACSDHETQEGQAIAIDGKTIFQKNCTICHGVDGKLELNGAKDLSLSQLTLNERIAQITNGKGLMTSFKGVLTEKKIKAVAEYSLKLNTTTN